MNKFSSNNLYIGTLMIIKKRLKVIYRENVYLIYEEKTDKFYSLENTLNEFIDLSLNKNLTEEQKNELKEKIRNFEYDYISSSEDNKIFVDVNSLKRIENGDKYGNIRSTGRK